MANEINSLKSSFNTTDWLDLLLRDAVELKASDIHIEPKKESFQIRLRIDGILRPYSNTDWSKFINYDELIQRLKILAGLDIAESRLPQDGHFEFTDKITNQKYNIRISTMPTIFKEAVALRILNRGDLVMKIEELGFDNAQLEVVRHLIRRKNGCIIVCGPVGSGKTTLLYSIINELKNVSINIATLEDPVEYVFPDIRQTQVNNKIGLDFAKGLRHLLRQDADIILVGEIRDEETAEIAIRASLAGQLVLTTVHSYDSLGVIARLHEMKIGKATLANSINGIIASRLVRKNCPYCLEEYKPSESLLKHFNLKAELGESQTPVRRGGNEVFVHALSPSGLH
ncbi:MAG: GspE/PulE family protein [Candidatus Omnitrophica bacterium]|nr:GspE/PulE family protein [Candidatus Omnitrophota bacterium]